MNRSVSRITIAVMMASGFATASADDTAATVSDPVMVSVERGGLELDISTGTELQTGDVIKLSNNDEIIVQQGIVTFGDLSCSMTTGIAYTLDLGAGVAAKLAGDADVCGALLTQAPITQAAAAAAGGATVGTTAAGGGNAPLIIGGIVVAAGGIAAAAGGGGGGDGDTPTSP